MNRATATISGTMRVRNIRRNQASEFKSTGSGIGDHGLMIKDG
jgi:hypothetical protein